MVCMPYILQVLYDIYSKTPTYTLVLELTLLIFLIWLILYKNGGHSQKLSRQQEDDIVLNYKPEPLVNDTPNDHPFLKPHLVTSRIGKFVNINGIKCLNLATHNYLGLLENEKIQKEAIISLRKYGVGSCGPRGFYGTVDVHLTLEERLAQFMKMEEAIVYSYGFSTIACAIPAYSKRMDIIFADEMVNFAIQKGLDASRSTVYFFKHNDMNNLENLLCEQALRDKKNKKKAAKIRRFLIVEGIYMNTGKLCPLPKLIELKKKFKLRLFLDESISFGTLGIKGRGITEHFEVERCEIDLISAGLEGAVASIGGFCVGSSFIVEHQRLSSLGYCFSASIPPLLAQSAITALDYFEKESYIFLELQSISKKFHSVFKQLSLLNLNGDEVSPIKHLYFKKKLDDFKENDLIGKIVEKCIQRNLVLTAASYLHEFEKFIPRPSIRIAVNRLLNEKDIENAFSIIEIVSKDIFLHNT